MNGGFRFGLLLAGVAGLAVGACSGTPQQADTETETSSGDDAGADDGACPDGSGGCACYGNDTCDSGLECIEGTCFAPDCEDGTEDCPCYGNATCDSGLSCEDGVCKPPSEDDDGSTASEESTGDGDGDESGTGDGDGDAVCDDMWCYGAPAIEIPSCFLPRHRAFADFDGNGLNDIVLSCDPTSDFSDVLQVHLNLGEGTFLAPFALAENGADFYGVVAEDFNEDRFADVGLLDGSQFRVFFGNGNGTFQDPVVHNSGWGTEIASADLNGDSNIDVVIASGWESGVNVLLGDGSGGFVGPVTHSEALSPELLRVADMDQDGAPDVITVDTKYDNQVAVYLNDGSGELSTPIPVVINSAVGTVAVHDFTGDGFPDVAAGSNQSVLLYENLGNGWVDDPQSFSTLGQQHNTLHGFDFDFDGDIDLAAGLNSGPIRIWRNDGPWGMWQMEDDVDTPDYTWLWVDTVDLSGDSVPDLIAAPTTSTLTLVIADPS